MRVFMKKFLSIFLSLAPFFSFQSGFSGVDVNSRSQIPVIRISGDGEALWWESSKIFITKDVAKLVTESHQQDNTELYKSIAKAFFLPLRKGFVTDNWDDLCAGLETEISKIFSNSLLDENGNVTNNSGLSEKRKQQMENRETMTRRGQKGYSWEDYWFHWLKLD